MPEGMTWDNIPQALLIDCAQLVKANSIEGVIAFPGYILTQQLKEDSGNKKDDLTIIYTPGDNLKVRSIPEHQVRLDHIDAQKTGDMAVGQVSFHSDKKVREQPQWQSVRFPIV
jgi:hypothetical protein